VFRFFLLELPLSECLGCHLEQGLRLYLEV